MLRFPVKYFYDMMSWVPLGRIKKHGELVRYLKQQKIQSRPIPASQNAC